jgi:hypothetical protein
MYAGENKKHEAFETLAKELQAEYCGSDKSHIPLLKEILAKYDVDGESDEAADKTVCVCVSVCLSVCLCICVRVCMYVDV